MGYAVLIDVLGSMVIGGFLLLTLIRFNDNATHNTYSYSGELTIQENLVATIGVLEYDLRKIGYCEAPLNIPNPAKAILYADTARITYLTDIDFNGTVDTLSYYLGPASELSGTPNPNDRLLYRSVNGQPQGVNLGVTEFKLKYFDALGLEITPPVSAPTGISLMQVDVKVENIAAYDSDYHYVYWRQIRLASRNLTNR